MSQYITNFKNNAMHCLEVAGEIGKGIGSRIVTLDRSEEVYGKTVGAQLWGRSYMITHELAKVILGTFIVAITAYMCMMHPGGMNYFLLGTFGVGTLVALKEVAIQSIARQKEKERYEIIGEPPEIQYSWQELMDEVNHNLNHSMEQLLRLNQKNEASNIVELQEMV